MALAVPNKELETVALLLGVEPEDEDRVFVAVIEIVPDKVIEAVTDFDGVPDDVGLGEQLGCTNKPSTLHTDEHVHGVGTIEFKGQYEPTGHMLHVAFVIAPIAAEKVPAGHRVALTELKGQNEPAGQRTGAPEKQ